MCDPIFRGWWVVFFVIVFSGAMGGFARYQWDKNEENSRVESWFHFVVMGIAAAFLVPLFLNTISSSLIKETETDPSKFFILIGFCIAASMYAKKFIGSVAEKTLEELKAENKKTSVKLTGVEERVKDAEDNARSADNRAIALYKPIELIGKEKYSEALKELETVIAFDPKNPEAWAWKAFCLKRQSKFEDAVSAIETALRLEGKEVCTWLYNLACYKCLAKTDVSEVIAALERIKVSASSELIALVGDKLKGDEEDFASIRQDTAFAAFLDGFK